MDGVPAALAVPLLGWISIPQGAVGEVEGGGKMQSAGRVPVDSQLKKTLRDLIVLGSHSLPLFFHLEGLWRKQAPGGTR